MPKKKTIEVETKKEAMARIAEHRRRDGLSDLYVKLQNRRDKAARRYLQVTGDVSEMEKAMARAFPDEWAYTED
jgi:hypothetical protein